MWWFAVLVHLYREMKQAMPDLTKDCVMKLRWRGWYFARLVLVLEPAWCSHLLVAGRWLELRLIAGTRTAAEVVLEVWAWEEPRMLEMDQVLQCMVVLLMVRTATALHRSLRD
jgi:hypothetical protein